MYLYLRHHLWLAFGMLRDIVSSSLWEKKKGTEKNPHPFLGEKVRDIIGCFEQVVLKSPLAESVIFMLSGHSRGRHIWGSRCGHVRWVTE